MPNKEEVLKWYASLKNTLKQEGIDVSKPGDLMRVRAMYCREDPDQPGERNNAIVEFRYAFVKKNIDKNTQQRTEYQNEMPVVKDGDAEKIADYVKHYQKKLGAVTEESSAYNDLKTAHENKEPYTKIVKLQEKYERSQKALKEEDKAFHEYCDELWKETDQWVFNNNSFYDGEKDYDQIEDLYNQAKEGLLFIDGLSNDHSDKKQIFVNKEGTSTIGPSLNKVPTADEKYPQHCDFRMAKGGKKERLEKEYGKFPQAKSLKNVILERFGNKPKPIKDGKKPGKMAWFKRIISFGLVHGEFDRYERQHNEFLQRKEEIKQYNQSIQNPEFLKEVRENNEAAYKKYDELVGRKYEEDKVYPENVENIGAMTLAHQMIGQRIVSPADAMIKDGDYSLCNLYMQRHLLELAVEYNENPASFKENGVRDKEESKKYWEKKVSIDAGELEHKEKVEKKQKEWAKDAPTSEIASEVVNRVKAEERLYEDIAAKNSWAKISEAELSKKIGQMVVPDKMDNVQAGRAVISTICSQNQRVDRKGNPLLENQIKTNEQCLQELSGVIDGIKEADLKLSKESYNKFKEQVANPAKGRDFENEPLKRCIDSLASVIATGMKNVEGNKIPHPIAQASMVFVNLLGQIKEKYNLDDIMSKPLCMDTDKKDVSVSTPEQREVARQIGTKCMKAQRAYQTSHADEKKNFVSKDKVKAKEIEELITKRPHNLNLS